MTALFDVSEWLYERYKVPHEWQFMPGIGYYETPDEERIIPWSVMDEMNPDEVLHAGKVLFRYIIMLETLKGY